LKRGLGDADALFLRRDRADPLVVLPWATWARLVPGMARAEHGPRRSPPVHGNAGGGTTPDTRPANGSPAAPAGDCEADRLRTLVRLDDRIDEIG